MKYVRKKMENKGVSPVIAVILMVAITVVLAGVLFVFVMGLDPGTTTTTILELDASDASASSDYVATGDNTVFEDDEPILKLVHRGGDPIDWNQYKIMLQKTTEDFSYECKVMAIGAVPYTAGDQSEVGDVILIECEDSTNPFAPGDYVKVTIYSADKQVFASNAIRIT